MNIKYTFGLLILLLLGNATASAQVTTWVPYDSLRYIKSMEPAGDHMWIGSHGYGLIKLDRTNGQKDLYLNANNGLPSSYVNAIHVDKQGYKWFGTGNPFEGGISKFDTNFIVTYDTCNSPLPSHYVTSIAEESNGTLWFGTYGGVARFDGTNWTIYDTSNSAIQSNLITSIAVYGNNKYFGTVDSGLIVYNGFTFMKYDSASGWIDDNFVTSVTAKSPFGVLVGTYGGGASWLTSTIYKFNTSNSDLPDNFVTSVAFDGIGNKWFATGNFYGGPGGGGVARLNTASDWWVFNTGNSDLPTNHVNVLAVDAAGDIWMGGGEHSEVGIAVYKWINGVEETVSSRIALEQNYPNPAKSTTYIRYTLDASSQQQTPVQIRILDLLGNEISSVNTVSEPESTYEVAFNTGALPNGTYIYTLQAAGRTETRTMSVLHD